LVAAFFAGAFLAAAFLAGAFLVAAFFFTTSVPPLFCHPSAASARTLQDLDRSGARV
jgi:hypothetical protein